MPRQLIITCDTCNEPIEGEGIFLMQPVCYSPQLYQPASMMLPGQDFCSKDCFAIAMQAINEEPEKATVQ